jgi:hypothetical protein
LQECRSTETEGETPANKRAGAAPHPYLKESLGGIRGYYARRGKCYT